MASLTDAIRAFQSGDLSPNEFFAQIDHVLAADHADGARLLAILAEEEAKTSLPHSVYTAVHQRVEHLASLQRNSNADQTRVQTNPADHFPLGSLTSPASKIDKKSAVELERMKGVGDTLNGRFLLQECLGFGGMGTVYKALDLRKLEASDRNPYIAIKALNVQFRGHPKSLIALQREAKKAQTLAHPNIVTVYDFDRDGTMVFLTMEYLSGKPLSQTLRTPGFAGMPFAQAMPIVSGMARALAYAHERGFVHCDFKPANVFLTDTGQVKVIDFGIARVFQRPEDDGEATVFDAGSLGGLTPAYASPEMLEHREPDPRDDIYALACITYELLTGRHPFGRLPATQARNAGVKPQRPKNIGHKQWRALKSALSFDREARTRTVARFLQEISGERRAAKYVGIATSGLIIAGLLTVAIKYYWDSPNGQSGQQVITAPVDRPQTMQPSTPTLSLANVTPILAQVPCSATVATVRDRALQVQGYIPKSVDITRFKEMLSAIPGVTTLDVDVQQVSEDKCDVIKIFAPYWTNNRQTGRKASIHTKAPGAQLTEGEPLIVDITTPEYNSYVNVDYFVLDGNVVHMVPSPRAKDNQAPPNYSATIGSLGNWEIAKPFGSELIVLLVTPAPLFDNVRPEYESTSDYLRAVEKQLKQMTAKYGPERIAVDFVQITTQAREKNSVMSPEDKGRAGKS
ncbi:MAG: protein kinase [Pseudomonadota bacterium]